VIISLCPRVINYQLSQFHVCTYVYNSIRQLSLNGHVKYHQNCPACISHPFHFLAPRGILIFRAFPAWNPTLPSPLRGRLHVRFSIWIPVRFGVRFAAKSAQQVIFWVFLVKMCKQTIVMGDRKRIGSLFCLRTNRARNRTAILTRIRTRVKQT
jgi:hypothetical protein